MDAHTDAAMNFELPTELRLLKEQVRRFVDAEMIPVEIFEETARTDRMGGDLQIVNMLVPVLTDRLNRRHARDYSKGRFQMTPVGLNLR